MKFTDSPRPDERRVQARPPDSPPESRNDYDYGRLFPAKENGSPAVPPYAPPPSDNDFSRYQDRLRRGKVKVCSGCGGVMTKTSRMVLSLPAGVGLIVLGALLMALYGFATYFLQPPWFLKFSLPAIYYIGSIFIGVGTMFFFIRERIWLCRQCRDIAKR